MAKKNDKKKRKSKNKKKSALPRIATVGFLGLLIASLCLTTIDLLARLDGLEEEAWFQPLLEGNLLPLMFSGTLWSAFPSVAVSVDMMLAILPGILTLVIAGVCTFLFRRVARCKWTTVGLAIASVSSVPLVCGTFGMFAKVPPTELGSWASLMLLTLLYGSALCTGCALLDVVMPNAKEQRKVTTKAAHA